MQENRAVYADIPAATTTSVPVARGRRGAQASCRPAASQPGPSTSAPGPTPRAKRDRTAGGGRTHGFTTPRAATTSDIQVGSKRKRTPKLKIGRLLLL